MEPDDIKPHDIHRNRPLTVNQLVRDSDQRRIHRHANRQQVQPNGLSIHQDHGCRIVSHRNPVNPGVPNEFEDPKQLPNRLTRMVEGIESGSIEVRPRNGTLLPDVSSFSTLFRLAFGHFLTILFRLL